jgi:hypothetical protein
LTRPLQGRVTWPKAAGTIWAACSKIATGQGYLPSTVLARITPTSGAIRSCQRSRQRSARDILGGDVANVLVANCWAVSSGNGMARPRPAFSLRPRLRRRYAKLKEHAMHLRRCLNRSRQSGSTSARTRSTWLGWINGAKTPNRWTCWLCIACARAARLPRSPRHRDSRSCDPEERFHILGRDQTHVVTKRRQLATDMMRAERASMPIRQARDIGETAFELPTRYLLLQNDGVIATGAGAPPVHPIRVASLPCNDSSAIGRRVDSCNQQARP